MSVVIFVCALFWLQILNSNTPQEEENDTGKAILLVKLAFRCCISTIHQQKTVNAKLCLENIHIFRPWFSALSLALYTLHIWCEDFDESTNKNVMYQQNYRLFLLVEYNNQVLQCNLFNFKVNGSIIMTHVSGRRWSDTFRVLIYIQVA